MAAVVAGAVVGAGVAVAGAIALSNKKNQEKLKGFVEGIHKEVGNRKDEVEEKMAEGKKKATNTLKTMKNAKKEVKSIWQK
ncbi:hypothetical protein COY48_04395 [Candidatus Collierbacteria bacterium CG_4_10_14_0_8_um_filter_43_86]|nr:MAG: hypothetical protein COY48_04395 [Candidatus Collierbacteria bacterium CG_4_10_14_0_8_um_filter_43_86]PJB48900.1 MAG: hypothetical protein CO104_00165 [Candidatus Collierbacteria bacterium CG_4_9_14_3_um_filter_43_16]